MKMARVSTALGLVLASAAVLLAPAASAAGGELAGTWTSTDTDGSHQTLTITGSGQRVYAMTYVDEEATQACGGAQARITGPGHPDESGVLMIGRLVCQPGGDAIGERLVLGFGYDAATDTLTDDFGIEWTRGG